MIRNSSDLLVRFQEIRRRYPALTSEMNLVIDLLCEGQVSEAVDEFLALRTRAASEQQV